MATKTKAKKKRPPPKPDIPETSEEWFKRAKLVEPIGAHLENITAILKSIHDVLVRSMVQVAPGPASEYPGGEEAFISGQWHRRPGNVYDMVAEPNTPNAGKVGQADE